MGKLKPGATYIYERADGITYAREFGSSDRQIVGWDYDTKSDLKQFHNQKMWSDVLKEAETNATLQHALERVILLYKLSKEKYE